MRIRSIVLELMWHHVQFQRRIVVSSEETQAAICEAQVHELVMKIKKYLSENPGCLGDGTIMPNPLNLNCMFKLSHQALVIWAEASVNGLAMLSTPPNNEEFLLEVEKGLLQDKEKSTEDLIGLNVQHASD
ncbi:hypothetical protein CROQUDRAFT_477462 [Cronartium quercuum f. sp. fusiforme G11]|uniref:Uncharacterized protein n=1 Tax=Cronartium quercuum f. sp. fusiforme G11 TaxID=708437 RepID=A0A9P6TCH4_9BASI|nr:hypothetical protein CROQUDRAFT_477462 [Cronartium quercuum f. sp. fusiforme G11]